MWRRGRAHLPPPWQQPTTYTRLADPQIQGILERAFVDHDAQPYADEFAQAAGFSCGGAMQPAP